MSSVRKAVQGDLATIMQIERRPEFRTCVGSWSEMEHTQTLIDPDAAYWVITGQHHVVEGFCIIRGLSSEDRSVELKRIAVATPNVGHGRKLLSAVCETLFKHYKVHRIWLDVFEHNERARRFYRSFGFQDEGVLREAIHRDGLWHSLVLMSVLDREYLSSKENA